MEYLPNGDLNKYLSSPLPEKEGQHIISQILEGLHFMHDKGFAHRDLKPAVSLAINLIRINNISLCYMNNIEYIGCVQRPRLVG